MKMYIDDVMNNLPELKHTPKFEQDQCSKEAKAVQKQDSNNQHSALRWSEEHPIKSFVSPGPVQNRKQRTKLQVCLWPISTTERS